MERDSANHPIRIFMQDEVLTTNRDIESDGSLDQRVKASSSLLSEMQVAMVQKA